MKNKVYDLYGTHLRRTIKIQYFLIAVVVFLILITIVIYSQMPKRYCHEEITTEKIVLEGFNSTWLGKHFTDLESRGIGEKDIYFCEEGIEVTDLRSIGTIWFNGDGVCILKHINKVCEVKYNE